MVRLAWSATAAACAMAMLVLMLFETRNSKTTVTIHDGASFENKTLKIIELLQSVKELLKPPAARDDSVMPPFIFPQLYRCKKTMQEVQSLPAEHASQSREDIWLYEKIFSFLPENDLIGGTFLEIGALDGRTFSNTLYFEKKWDWRGILIEGHPANQPALRAAQDFRQNSAIFTTAICELTEDGAVQTLTFTTSGGAVGAALEHANTGFLSSWHNGDKGGLKADCIPLQSIIDATGLLDIHLFSLDVEGAEFEVLKTLDLRKTNIYVIVVELDAGNKEKDQRVRSHLVQHGFENAETRLGSIRSACAPGGDCTMNEVFINPQFPTKKRGASHRHVYGTGMAC